MYDEHIIFMKKLIIKILPYFVALMTGITVYLLTETLIKDSGLNNLLINIASGLISIPLVFVFYEVINKITSRNLHNSLFESVTFEINTHLVNLINILCAALNHPNLKNVQDLDDFLNLDSNDISQILSLKNTQITTPLYTVKENLTTIIHKQSSFEILSEEQIASILNIIKEISILIKNMSQQIPLKQRTHFKKLLAQDIERIIDNITLWIESGKKDAFQNHARFSFQEDSIK